MASDDGDLTLATTMQPAAAMRYLASKGVDVSWDWHDTWELMHARAFVVAKAAKLDVLAVLRAAVERALASGQTRREFVRELEPKLRALGWWGRQEVTGPDGVAREVQLGSHRRLRTIYETNMRVAYAHGKYRRQLGNADSRPYWMYDAINDSRTRPSHAAMDGRVFRYDDPIWHTHYPPNGFNCRCSVRALTERQVERMGLDVHESGRHLQPARQIVGYDRTTGEAIERPATTYWIDAPTPRAVTPDPGWNYNPGRSGDFGPIQGLDADRIDTLVAHQRNWRDYGLTELAPRAAPPRLPRAESAVEAKRQIRAALGPWTIDREFKPIVEVTTPDGLENIVLSERMIDHVTASASGREQFAMWVIPTLEDPDEVWLQARLNNGRVEYARVFVTRYDRGFGVLVQERRFGLTPYTFYPERDLNRKREGVLLYRRS